MSCDCGGCVGLRVATTAREQNRPGLSRIDHRPGRYGTFAQAMRTRLASTDYPELAGLKTRAPVDASMALCDAWAIAAEVLSFYQDRIANEGYLRTSTERRSLIELGRLTGYALRPGVSASVYLAYDVDPNAGHLTIPPGTRAQSVPGAGEKMQTFETADALDARAQWSQIKVRLSEPAWRSADEANADYGVLVRGLTLRGTSTQLKPNDALLIDYGDRKRVPYRVASIVVDNETQNTRVTLRGWNAVETKMQMAKPMRLSSADLVGRLDTQLTLQPRSALHLARTTETTLRRGGEIYSRLLARQSPGLREMLIPAMRSFAASATTQLQPISVYALRSKNALFGNAAPSSVLVDPEGPQYEPLSLAIAWSEESLGVSTFDVNKANLRAAQKFHSIPLDGSSEAIKPGDPHGHPSYAVVDFGGLEVVDERGASKAPRVHEVIDNQSVAMSIGAVMSAKVSQLTTKDAWLVVSNDQEGLGESLLRRTQIYAQSEKLELAPDPLETVVAGDESANEIELDAYYDGLVPGLWVIASGDRADIADRTIKVPAAERAMIAAVRHDVSRITLGGADGVVQTTQPLPGDTLHTFIKLAQKLAYTYRRETFVLYGNVVRATHGETRIEPLGGGDATRTFQSFTLKSPPLTYVAAASPSGVASTLQVRVNKLLWKASDDLANAAADARVYATRRGDSEATTIRFGDGVHGARLPSGPDNVAAVYRTALGSAGNVRAGQITLATDKPLGIRGVLNPIRASGGADPDTLEQARVNAPLAVTALDRLVSIPDYADFARGFAGIGKAAAVGLHDGFKSVVHVTVAGIEDEPIDATSDLFVNLVAALRTYGDPHLPVRVQVRRALSLMLQASVAIDPDYRWEDVQPRVRQALLDRFGFAARELSEPVYKSQILAAIESVQGVEHVFGLTAQTLDRDAMVAGLDPAEATPTGSDAGANAVKRLAVAVAEHGWLDVASASIADDGSFVPAQIAYLPADVTDCLILELAS